MIDTGDGDVHFAASIALCLSVGCPITDLEGNPWRLGASGIIAAANPEVHARLLRWTKELAL